MEITKYFELDSLEEALKQLSNDFSRIEQELPYGLSYGDLYHIVDAFYSIGLRGQNVLEFGGKLDREFIETHIKPSCWHSITLDLYESDYRHNENQLIRDQINIEAANTNYAYTNLGLQFLSIAQHIFGDNKPYSRIFSVAAFEHLRQPLNCMQNLYELCKENTLMYSFFTPVWSAPNGHHWSYCPVTLPPYIHLAMRPWELKQYLISEGNLSEVDAERHCHFIYSSTRINRLTPGEWKQVFSSMSFNIVECHPISPMCVDNLNVDTISKKKIFYSIQSRDICSGYRLIAKK